jgi:predicted RNA polymerase sigma factor
VITEEEAAGEALVVALERWPVEGTPPNPGGWLMTTAGRRARARLRTEVTGSNPVGRVRSGPVVAQTSI